MGKKIYGLYLLESLKIHMSLFYKIKQWENGRNDKTTKELHKEMKCKSHLSGN